jgi:hypothetical protein
MTQPRALLEQFDATTGGSGDDPDKTTDMSAAKKDQNFWASKDGRIC